MKRKSLLKRIIAIVSITMVAGIFTGCGSSNEDADGNGSEIVESGEKAPGDYKGTLNIWSFTDEPKSAGMIDAFNEVYPNVKVELTVVPMEDNAYSTKLASVLSSGVGAPDVFTSEVSFVKRFANMDYYEDLSKAPYNAEELAKEMVNYTVDLGRNDVDNSIRALTWQAAPGGIYYKRSVAKEYLGTDDPDEVSAMITTMDDLIKTGEKIRDASNGKAFLFPGYGELGYIVRANRSQPWVVDNKLVIDDMMMAYVDEAKIIRDGGLDAKIGQWTPEWSGAMQGKDTFGFVLPTWGLNYVVKTNAPDTTGDWGLAKAPTPYYNGGTWMGMYNGSKNKELAWEFIKFTTTNEDWLTEYATATGDFVNNNNVIEVFANSDAANNEFLGGQNVYKTYSEMVPDINGKLVTDYDETINNKWSEALDLYITGEKSKEDFLKQFKEEVKSAFPDITVE